MSVDQTLQKFYGFIFLLTIMISSEKQEMVIGFWCRNFLKSEILETKVQ